MGVSTGTRLFLVCIPTGLLAFRAAERGAHRACYMYHSTVSSRYVSTPYLRTSSYSVVAFQSIPPIWGEKRQPLPISDVATLTRVPGSVVFQFQYFPPIHTIIMKLTRHLIGKPRRWGGGNLECRSRCLPVWLTIYGSVHHRAPGSLFSGAVVDPLSTAA